MTAQFDSQVPRDPSQQSSDDYETYVPEREFVLMPFFRRIGQRLGFGRNPAEQSIYAGPPEETRSELPPVEQAPLPPAPVAQQEPLEPEITPAVSAFHSAAASAHDDRDAAYPISTVDPAPTPTHAIVSSLELAAEKISGALSGSAQWLERKQEQILQAIKPQELSAEALVQVPQKEPIPFPKTESLARNEERQIAAETPHSGTPAAEQADAQLTVPALQRELAWEEHSEPQIVAMAPQQTSVAPEPISPPIATWWQHRIDWSKYLTSKRVALIGGLAMAALIIIGISLARRPAADMLPQQTATRPVEPGGVTLSTHPVVTRARTQQQSVPASSHRSPRKAHTLADDDGPEVVTHYYNQKPSPVHQATVNGVRHYSDLN